MADRDLQSQPSQALRRCTFGLIRARDLVAEVVQDFGDAAHAGAADSDEMDPLDGVFHDFTIASISSATRLAARGRARPRAFSAMLSKAARSSPQSN